MRIFGYIFIVGVLVLNIASCKLGSLDDPIVISDVEKEFYIDLRETLTVPGRQFYVDIRTIGMEPCLNSTIATELDRKTEGFDISINQINEPADCQQGEAPAIAAINLGPLSNRSYDFTIDLKNTIYNLGKLSVDQDRIVVEMQTEEGIIFLHDELLRVPNQTVWGFVAGDESTANEESLNFVEDLEGLGNAPSYLKGYYHYYTINTDGSVVVNHEKVVDRNFVHSFIFNYTGDKATMVDQLEAFRAAHSDVDVYFFTAQGEEW